MPELKIRWDAEKQLAFLDFKPEEFKSWDFIIAALGMAMETAKSQRTFNLAAQMQAAHAEAERTQAIRGRLKLP